MPPQSTQRWIRNLTDPAPMRLICFPHAGAGGSAYRGWILPGIAVCPVVLPGREDRFREAPLHQLPDIVREINLAMSACSDRPFAFFGHSMGALLAFETARTLRREGRTGPVHLFVSGREAPHMPDNDEPVHQLPDDGLIASLVKRGGTPPEVLRERELMELLLPAIRADHEVCETYVYLAETALSTPMTVLGGRDDEVTRDELEGWWQHTERPGRLHWFEGGHFYPQEQASAVCATITQTLQAR